MSTYCVEFCRCPGGDSLELPISDYQAIAKTARSRGASVLPIYPEPDGEIITAAQGKAIATALENSLPESWDAVMVTEFLSFLRCGAFRIEKVCLA